MELVSILLIPTGVAAWILLQSRRNARREQRQIERIISRY